jgi:hypothetical protein
VIEVKKELTEEQFLAKKLKYHDYGLSQAEVMELQRQGLYTIGDLLGKDTKDCQFMKSKKGIPCAPRFTAVRREIQKHYVKLFGIEYIIETTK